MRLSNVMPIPSTSDFTNILNDWIGLGMPPQVFQLAFVNSIYIYINNLSSEEPRCRSYKSNSLQTNTQTFPTVLTIEPRTMSIFLTNSSILLSHMSFKCLFHNKLCPVPLKLQAITKGLTLPMKVIGMNIFDFQNSYFSCFILPNATLPISNNKVCGPCVVTHL